MTGRHRSPPEPPPPMLARWLPHIAVLAAVGIVGPPVVLFAATIGADASAASAAAVGDSVTVSTAARSARTVHVPLTVLPVPVPSIGAEGAWDPETENALSRPVPSERFAAATGTATTSEALTADPVATTAPLATEQQPTTLPTTTRTWARTTRTNPPTSPATSAAATSSAPTTTEETPVTEEPTEPTVTVDVTAEVTG